jgi:predicted transglutaminase-like cysteine proteinase
VNNRTYCTLTLASLLAVALSARAEAASDENFVAGVMAEVPRFAPTAVPTASPIAAATPAMEADEQGSHWARTKKWVMFVSKVYSSAADAPGQFSEVMRRHADDVASGRLAQDPGWRELSKDMFDLRRREKSTRRFLEEFDAGVNGYIRYATDQEQYHVEDHWASPLETLKSRQGDCEDYAILKYYLLKQVIPPKDMLVSISMVNTISSSGQHAVLLVRDGDSVYVMSNPLPKPHNAWVQEAGLLSYTLEDLDDASEYSLMSAFNEAETVTSLPR